MVSASRFSNWKRPHCYWLSLSASKFDSSDKLAMLIQTPLQSKLAWGTKQTTFVDRTPCNITTRSTDASNNFQEFPGSRLKIFPDETKVQQDIWILFSILFGKLLICYAANLLINTHCFISVTICPVYINWLPPLICPFVTQVWWY